MLASLSRNAIFHNKQIHQARREYRRLGRLVDRIHAAKKQNSETDLSALEREIDQLVYGLYGLTREEILIIEGAAK